MATKKLAGKVAVVTGASKGIGAAIAKHLADEGASVVANYASSKEGADRVVAEIVPPQPTRAAFTAEAVLAKLMRQGVVSPPIARTGKPPRGKPVAPLAKLVAELREDRNGR